MVVLVALVASVVVIGPSGFFLPAQSTPVNEEGCADAEVLTRGSFVGAAGLNVSGTVELVRDGDGLGLRFENYSQQQGPDGFVYVTPSATPDTSAEINAGTEVLIEGAPTTARARKRRPGDLRGTGK